MHVFVGFVFLSLFFYKQEEQVDSGEGINVMSLLFDGRMLKWMQLTKLMITQNSDKMRKIVSSDCI